MKNLARDGAPKTSAPVMIHNAMYHMRNGALIAGVSKTQAAHPLDDSKRITAPTVAKNLRPVGTTPGMRSR